MIPLLIQLFLQYKIGFKKYYDLWVNIGKLVWIILTVLVAIVKPVTDFIVDSVARLSGQIAALAVPDHAMSMINQNLGAVLGWLRLANYILPVDEMLTCGMLLSTLWIIALTYRFIKSWIPTVN